MLLFSKSNNTYTINELKENSQTYGYWLVLIIGITLRLVQYLYNRSLWLDESYLANGLIDFQNSIFEPLPNKQSAPILFLIIERGFIRLFGTSEYALRLFPLLSSLISLPLAYSFFKKISDKKMAVLIAFSFFAISPYLIYYSSELKQYASDVLVFLMLTNIALSRFDQRKKYFLLTIAGVVSIFLSNISVFVLVFVFLYLLFEQIRRKKIKWDYIFSGIILLSIFSFYYLKFVHNHPHKEFMVDYWEKAFMPINIFSTTFWSWFSNSFAFYFKKLFFDQILGSTTLQILTAITFIFYLLGLISETKQKNYMFFYLMLYPLAFHLAFSALKIYPFYNRFLLYLSPIVFFVVANGIVFVLSTVKSIFFKRIIATIVVVSFSICSIYAVPIEKEEIKQALRYIKNYIEPNNSLVLNKYSFHPFKYYTDNGYEEFKDFKATTTQKKELVISDFQNFVNSVNGTWFIFTHNNEKQTKELEKILEYYKNNQQLKHYYEASGTVAIFIKD